LICAAIRAPASTPETSHRRIAPCRREPFGLNPKMAETALVLSTVGGESWAPPFLWHGQLHGNADCLFEAAELGIPLLPPGRPSDELRPLEHKRIEGGNSGPRTRPPCAGHTFARTWTVDPHVL
jgi:hypothetical protein